MGIFKNKSDKGFSLLEVMVAISIIAIGITAVFGLQVKSLSLADEARFKTTASLLAQQKIAEIESNIYHDLNSDSGDFGEEFPEYRWHLSINDTSIIEEEDVSENLKQIDLEITREDDEKCYYFLRLYHYTQKTG